MVKNKYNISLYNTIEDYIQGGSKGTLTDDEQEYMHILFLMNTMRHKYGKLNTIKFFQKEPFNITAYSSKRMFDECINLFYSHENIEKAALRNVIAEDLENAANVVLETAQHAKDMEVYGDLRYKFYKIMQLDKPDPPKIPDELYKKPIKIYTLSPKNLGLTDDDRNELANEIDSIPDVREMDKHRFKQEANIIDIDFIELLNEQGEED